MLQAQTAIVPEAGPFALYTQLKVNQNRENVLAKLKALPELVEELNNSQPGADLTLSIAFTKSFWQHLNIDAPEELIDFPQLGEGDVVAPASDVDVLIHCHSTRHDLHFYVLRKFLVDTAEDVTVVDETYGYRYLDARDMTDFIDGTENPEGEARAEVALIKEGPFAGGSYVMAQRFEHNLPAWNRLNVKAQEKVITVLSQILLSWMMCQQRRTLVGVDIKEEGKGLKIVRHSLPYGTVTGAHGLLFICYCHTLHNIKVMLESMYGVTDGKTDQLLRFTKAVTGAYFFAPSQAMLAELAIK